MTTRPPARRRRLVAWAPWVVIVVVAAVALAVGTHRDAPRPSVASETLSIASQLRCPVCTGETAAESQTSASIEIRTEIRQRLLEGQSSAQILDYYRHLPGPSLLEDPSTHGSGLVLWYLPVGALVVALIGLVLAFRRWRPVAARGATEADRDLVDGQIGAEATRV